MNRRMLAVFVALLFVLSGMAIAQSVAPEIPKDVPNAARIAGYIQAFNAGESAMRSYLEANVADSGLKQRSVDERLGIYRQIQGRLKSLEFRGISNVQVSAESQEITAILHTGNGETDEFTFLFEPNPPNKLIGIRIQAGEGPGSAAPQQGPPISEKEFVDKVRDYLAQSAAKDEFSGAVLVARKGAVIFEKAYGSANKEAGVPNSTETAFNLGSINKLFTRLCIDQLIQQGKLSLDDKLGKFLPDYPNHDAAAKVTIRQLLTMRSGIGDFFGERFEAMPKEKLRTLADWLPLFADKPLLFEPGTGEQYSNGGYLVLGLIVQKVSGQDYYEYVKQHVFLPAGMTHTEFFYSDTASPNVARGYTSQQSKGARVPNTKMLPARGTSAGGGYSTLHDLLNFTQALADGKLVLLDNETGRPALEGTGVAGGSPGVNAVLEFEPRTHDTVIVLSNYDPPTAMRAAQQVRALVKNIK